MLNVNFLIVKLSLLNTNDKSTRVEIDKLISNQKFNGFTTKSKYQRIVATTNVKIVYLELVLFKFFLLYLNKKLNDMENIIIIPN